MTVNVKIKNHLYDVDNVIGQPEYSEGTDDQQDQAAAFIPALELGVFQTADDGGVTDVDEGEGHQATHDGLKHILEDFVIYAAPVVWYAEAQSIIAWKCLLQITVRDAEGAYKYCIR